MEGKVVLVQGASSGLGKELAMLYGKRGCRMVLTGRNKERLEQTAKEIQIVYRNSDVVFKVADGRDEKQASEVVDFAIKTFGRLDILVLSAG